MKKKVKRQKRIVNITIIVSILILTILGSVFKNIPYKALVLANWIIVSVISHKVDRCPYCKKYLGFRHSFSCPHCRKTFSTTYIR